MAKHRSNDLDFAEPEDPITATAPVDAEKESLRAELDRLRAENAKLMEQLTAPAPPQQQGQPGYYSGPLLYWKVSIPHGGERIVKAVDSVHAFDEYKRVMGVITTEHRPDVVQTDEAAWFDEQEKLNRAGMGGRK